MSVDQVIEDLRHRRSSIPDDDPRRFFLDAYSHSAQALAGWLDSGMFVDPDWTEQLAVVLAGHYLSAFDAHAAGGVTPTPWQVALDAGRSQRLPPLRLVLIGMNAHINFDLPQALVEMIAPDDFDDNGVIAHRDLDVRAVDEILASGVSEHDRELATLESRAEYPFVDRILRPFNRRGTHVFFTGARSKVWHNAEVLARARRKGVYGQRLEELEARVTRRLANLEEPRRVIVDLTRDGFGIELISDE